MEFTSGTPGNNIGIVWWGWGCQRTQICSLTMLHVSHPYLVSLSFYTIPICLFNILVLIHFLRCSGCFLATCRLSRSWTAPSGEIVRTAGIIFCHYCRWGFALSSHTAWSVQWKWGAFISPLVWKNKVFKNRRMYPLCMFLIVPVFWLCIIMPPPIV